MNKNRPQILAPAGSVEALEAALSCGADAVYAGGKAFSARQNASNFDSGELKKAVELAHLYNAQFHLTVNTVIFDSQLEEFAEFINYAAECGVDAFIVQDLGAASIIREIFPEAVLHASTQMTIHSVYGAEKAVEMGFKRVVLSREMSKEDIKLICDTGIETEIFVHGALCMCVSGQCYLSSIIGERSANRGLCAQPCRLPFSASGNSDAYSLSLKDLSLVQKLEDIALMGVSSLKIEGRMKRPEYVAAAVTACKKALEGEKPNMDMLRAVFSRNGFTDGYFTGKHENMFGRRDRDDILNTKSSIQDLKQLCRQKQKAADLFFEISIKENQPVRLTALSSDGCSAEVLGEAPEIAVKKPVSHEFLERQLAKLGDTVYSYSGVKEDIDSHMTISAKTVNELRRKACAEIDRNRIVRAKGSALTHPFLYSIQEHSCCGRQLRIRIENEDQLYLLSENSADSFIIPLRLFKSCKINLPKEKIIIEPPRFIINEKNIFAALRELYNDGYSHLLCGNIAYFKAYEYGYSLHGDFGLNITNSYSLKALEGIGLEDVTISFETKLSYVNKLGGNIKRGIIAYGKLPVMINRCCPVKNEIGCGKCRKQLQDRTGRTYKILCRQDYVELLNPQTLYMADRLDDIKNVDFITLYFTDEKPKEVIAAIEMYKSGSAVRPEGITRGLYYRGIK